MQGERRLTAVMFTDIVGYTALSQKDEGLALDLLEKHREILRPFFSKHDGREVKTVGDSFLVEFTSALEAVRCAFDIQQSMHEQSYTGALNPLPAVRIGIHLGDVIHSGNDVYGDAVNVASRIEPLAEPGGICVSQQVYDQVRNKFEFPFSSLGRKDLKNVTHPIEVFKAVLPWDERVQSASLDVHRVAVLPFASTSRDPEDEYFADGMTEELISSISNIGVLSVISRTSVMKFKGGGKTASEIGQELKAGTLLEGSVRKADNIVRVNAQLIDVNADRNLWSQQYDRELKNIFALQSEIARDVADSLRVRIVPPEMARINRKPTENTMAYTLYLKGRHLWNKRGFEEVKKAVEFFRQAIKEDPHFAPSYLGLADCYLILRSNWRVDVDTNFEKAKTMLGKAMELDPGLAEAHATEGLVLWGEYRLREAEHKIRKAIELKPSYAFGHMWYHLMLRDTLRWDEALNEIKKALELDPFSPIMNQNHALHYYAKGEYGKALELAKRVSELESDYVDNYWLMAWIHGRLKQFDDMKHDFESVVRLNSTSFPLISKEAELDEGYLRNDSELVKKLLPELETRLGETTMDSYGVAAYYFYLGEFDKGFEWLEHSYSRREYALLWIMWDPRFDKIRSDPRYIDLLNRTGLNQADAQ